jgi:hypothetical protein
MAKVAGSFTLLPFTFLILPFLDSPSFWTRPRFWRTVKCLNLHAILSLNPESWWKWRRHNRLPVLGGTNVKVPEEKDLAPESGTSLALLGATVGVCPAGLEGLRMR